MSWTLVKRGNGQKGKEERRGGGCVTAVGGKDAPAFSENLFLHLFRHSLSPVGLMSQTLNLAHGRISISFLFYLISFVTGHMLTPKLTVRA